MHMKLSTRSKRLASLLMGCGLLAASCGGDAGSAAGFCDQISALDSLDVDPTAGVDPTSDDAGEQMVAAFQDVAARFNDLEDAAPAEIADDVRLLAEGITALSDVFASVDGDFIALAGDEEALAQLEVLDSPEFDAASTNVETYVADECGIDIS